MKINKFLVLSLLEVLLLSSSDIALSQVVKKYDKFTDKIRDNSFKKGK
jgi:hypothetical protein